MMAENQADLDVMHCLAVGTAKTIDLDRWEAIAPVLEDALLQAYKMGIPYGRALQNMKR